MRLMREGTRVGETTTVSYLIHSFVNISKNPLPSPPQAPLELP
jgi:hypothetical protein